MKRTKENEDLSPEEIKVRISELKKELMKENTQVHSGSAVTSPGRIKKNKKSLARLKTILQQRGLS